MSQPTRFVPSYDFSVEMPGDDGNALDAMQDDIKLTTDELCENLELLQKDDGGLRNGLVTPYSLSADTVALLSDWTVRGAWVTLTVYEQLDLVTESGITYLCLVDHVAGTFATDLAAGKWTALSKVDSLSSAFSLTLLDDANAAAWLTTLGFSAFVQTLKDDANAAAIMTTLGFPANAQSFITAADYAAMRTALAVYSTTEAMPKSGGAFSGGVTGTTLGLSGTLTGVAATLSGLLTTNGQVKFPATANPSADVNTLDDYEEGTWTPSVGGTATYSVQLGTYTKIGRQVTVHCRLTINAIGSGSTSSISGLPFAAASSPAMRYTGAVEFQSLATNVVTVTARVQDGGTSVSLLSLAAAGTGQSSIAILGNSAVIHFSLTYEV